MQHWTDTVLTSLFLCKIFYHSFELSSSWDECDTQSAGLRVTVVGKLVTLHHRTQCEVHSLWVSQPQQQSRTKAGEAATLDAECFIALLRCSLPHAAQHQVPTISNGGESVTVTALTIKTNAPRAAQLHMCVIPDKCIQAILNLHGEKKKINILTTTIGSSITLFFTANIFMFHFSVFSQRPSF